MDYIAAFTDRVASAVTADEVRDILAGEVALPFVDMIGIVSAHARVFDRPLLMLVLVSDRPSPALAMNAHLTEADLAFAAEFLSARIIRNDPPVAHQTFASLARERRLPPGPYVQRMVDSALHPDSLQRAAHCLHLAEALVVLEHLTSEQVTTLLRAVQKQGVRRSAESTSLEVLLAAHPSAPPSLLARTLERGRPYTLNGEAVLALVARDDVRTARKYRMWLFRHVLAHRQIDHAKHFMSDDAADLPKLLNEAIRHSPASAAALAEPAFERMAATGGVNAIRPYLAHEDRAIRTAAIAALGAVHAEAPADNLRTAHRRR